MQAIVALGHGLGLTVIAEGVESDEQLAILREEGCDQAQGFLIGPPVPAEEFAALLGPPTPGWGEDGSERLVCRLTKLCDCHHAVSREVPGNHRGRCGSRKRPYRCPQARGRADHWHTGCTLLWSRSRVTLRRRDQRHDACDHRRARTIPCFCRKRTPAPAATPAGTSLLPLRVEPGPGAHRQGSRSTRPSPPLHRRTSSRPVSLRTSCSVSCSRRSIPVS